MKKRMIELFLTIAGGYTAIALILLYMVRAFYAPVMDDFILFKIADKAIYMLYHFLIQLI